MLISQIKNDTGPDDIDKSNLGDSLDISEDALGRTWEYIMTQYNLNEGLKHMGSKEKRQQQRSFNNYMMWRHLNQLKQTS